MSTIGTAGHVDHGKSALVRALTGVDPDRLAEERARGMTIDLGFAWLALPDGRVAGIVDVPGHEDFIKNMLAGVGGIDLALLVVDAHEGVMPQTVEHLGILDLLGVARGVVALTKADLVDLDLLDLARDEVAATLEGTTLAGASIVPVSALTRAGLTDLVAAIAAALPVEPTHTSVSFPRLPVDRVFTVAGFGTVVTGTLLGGPLRVGQEVEAQPEGACGRIRGMQRHKEYVTEVEPGSRVALNLAGIPHSAIARGTVIAPPGALAPTTRVTARLECWRHAPRPITHNAVLALFAGAAETPARVRLLDAGELPPGAIGWAELRLDRPIAVARNDRFIVRNLSPGETLGGGTIVETAARQVKRRDPVALARLAALAGGDPLARVTATLMALRGPDRLATPERIAARADLSPAAVTSALADLVAAGEAVAISPYVAFRAAWADLVATSGRMLDDWHARWPLRSGMPREAWRARLALAPRQVEPALVLLASQGAVSASAPPAVVARAGHIPRFTPEQAAALDAALAALRADPGKPPPRAALEAARGAEVLAAAAERGDLARLSDDVVVLAETYAAARDTLAAYLAAHDGLTVAAARDLLGATRRTIVPLLETLDAARVTRRVGDLRVLY